MKTTTQHKPVSLRIATELYKEMKIFCIKNDLSIKEYVTGLIEKDIGKRNQ